MLGHCQQAGVPRVGPQATRVIQRNARVVAGGRARAALEVVFVEDREPVAVERCRLGIGRLVGQQAEEEDGR